ncbi:MAG TPA: dTMP kinase [Spirochaetota bacterium]|nr:dTMP kinase [Spirochaetota bacterium]
MTATSFFIAFEGLDGSGKDTVLNRIFPLFYTAESSPLFISKFQRVLRTREPTSASVYGRKIIAGLQDGSLSSRPGAAVASWYIKDRKMHSSLIKKNMTAGVIVLSSRYDLSTYAYQMAMGVSFKDIYRKHAYGRQRGAVIPDLTLYFRLTPAAAMKRISSRLQQKEAFEKKAFLKKVYNCYNKALTRLKEKDQRRIAVINAAVGRKKVLSGTVNAIKRSLF